MTENTAVALKSTARLCIVTYVFGGNGPWNYFIESPPPNVKLVHFVGAFLGEDERHYLVACDWMTLEDGTVHPIHKKHFGKNTCQITFL